MTNDLDYITTPTNKHYTCFRPVQRPQPLVAFDIVDKLRDLEAETSCQILDELIARYPEVQEYLTENYIDLLTEEED